MSDCDDFDCNNVEHGHLFGDDSNVKEDLKLGKMKTLSTKLSALSSGQKNQIKN